MTMAPTKTHNAAKAAATTATSSSSITTTNPSDIVEMMSDPQNKIKGRNVSGRSWKVKPQKRATSLIKTTFNNQSKSWERRQQERVLKQQAKELQQELRDERKNAKILKKERRLENEKRRAENEYQNQLKFAQTLNLNKVDSKLKAMSKKQLRQIKKTRINPKTGVTEFVPAYTK